MATSVVVYTTDYCPYCTRAKRLLDARGIAFEEVNVEGRSDLRAWLVAESGQRTVPQIFINGTSVGGFDDLSALDRSGKLQGMLAEKPAAEVAALPR